MQENQNTYIVVEIKDMFKIEENNINYMLLESGTRYCLIKYSEYIQYEKENELNNENYENV